MFKLQNFVKHNVGLYAGCLSEKRRITIILTFLFLLLLVLLRIARLFEKKLEQVLEHKKLEKNSPKIRVRDVIIIEKNCSQCS